MFSTNRLPKLKEMDSILFEGQSSSLESDLNDMVYNYADTIHMIERSPIDGDYITVTLSGITTVLTNQEAIQLIEYYAKAEGYLIDTDPRQYDFFDAMLSDQQKLDDNFAAWEADPGPNGARACIARECH